MLYDEYLLRMHRAYAWNDRLHAPEALENAIVDRKAVSNGRVVLALSMLPLDLLKPLSPGRIRMLGWVSRLPDVRGKTNIP
jgi:hypothetical protein